VDNRTGFRRRGPAFLADQARQALGVAGEPRPLADIPPPLVHTALGAAVCGVCVLVRPEALGMRDSALATGLLALLTAVVLAGYDTLVYPRERRPPVDSVALPVAAVAAFATVLAGVPQIGIRAAAGALAALVIGGVPQLLGRSAWSGGLGYRIARDLAGLAVLAPVLVAGVSPVLSPLPRLGLAALCVLLVTYDALRAEGRGVIISLLAALLTAAALTAATFLAGTGSANAGERAALLLVLWYGVRGLAGSLTALRIRRPGVDLVEYAVFVLVAAGVLRLVLVSQ
jgi:hypothetical protein